MCGIVGYIGFRRATDLILEGLRRLEREAEVVGEILGHPFDSDVIAAQGAATTLVASWRPPSPTSMTATWTSAARNRTKAAAVVISKYVAGPASAPRRVRSPWVAPSPAPESRRARPSR